MDHRMNTTRRTRTAMMKSTNFSQRRTTICKYLLLNYNPFGRVVTVLTHFRSAVEFAYLFVAVVEPMTI